MLAVWDLCQTYPDWQAVPILNSHTNYLWGSTLTLLQVLAHLEGKAIAPPPADWDVGHFALLVGQLQGKANALYSLMDTYPHFGWNGLHLQPPEALAQSLHRPNQTTQGGVGLFMATGVRSHIKSIAEKVGLQIALWDNGSPINA